MHFYALIHKEPRSCYGVSFPDVPGCISAGDTLDEAVTNAVEALSGHLAVTRDHGEPLPSPRPLEALRKDANVKREIATGAVLVAVPLLLDAARTVRANLSLDAGLLDAIDEAARKRGLTRSAFLATAAREKIAAGR
jgi:predicted RNase H-like HicB family nuclease